MIGEKILLVQTKEQDLDFVIEIEHGPEQTPFVTSWSKEQHKDIFTDTDGLHLTMWHDGRRVGFIILKGLERENNSIELMRIAIGPKNRGYGREAITLIKKFAFEEKKAHRLWLDLVADNARAYHLYSSLGFVKEAELRDVLKYGDAYKNQIIMSILEHEYVG